MVLADSTKDLIDCGGEWISSGEMEAAIMAMPGVQEAAVVAILDKRIRCLSACVVPVETQTITERDVRTQLSASGYARWQIPQRVELVDDLPKTAVKEFDEKVLRSKFQA